MEALPSDTIWTLKWKIYENEDIRKHSSKDTWESLPSPDDQELMMDGERKVLDDCERTLESYSIHEGSKSSCTWRKENHYEDLFRSFLNVYRKKQTEMSMDGPKAVSWAKHVSIHIHEFRSIKFHQGEYMESLFRILIHSIPSLKKLDFSNNVYIGDKGRVRIAKSLEVNTSLKTLNLRGCGIGSIAAIRIAEMLEKNSYLLSLDLEENRSVGDEGWIRIAEALEINTSLKTLSRYNASKEITKRIDTLLLRNRSQSKKETDTQMKKKEMEKDEDGEDGEYCQDYDGRDARITKK